MFSRSSKGKIALYTFNRLPALTDQKQYGVLANHDADFVPDGSVRRLCMFVLRRPSASGSCPKRSAVFNRRSSYKRKLNQFQSAAFSPFLYICYIYRTVWMIQEDGGTVTVRFATRASEVPVALDQTSREHEEKWSKAYGAEEIEVPDGSPESAAARPFHVSEMRLRNCNAHICSRNMASTVGPIEQTCDSTCMHFGPA